MSIINKGDIMNINNNRITKQKREEDYYLKNQTKKTKLNNKTEEDNSLISGTIIDPTITEKKKTTPPKPKPRTLNNIKKSREFHTTFFVLSNSPEILKLYNIIPEELIAKYDALVEEIDGQKNAYTPNAKDIKKNDSVPETRKKVLIMKTWLVQLN